MFHCWTMDSPFPFLIERLRGLFRFMLKLNRRWSVIWWHITSYIVGPARTWHKAETISQASKDLWQIHSSEACKVEKNGERKCIGAFHLHALIGSQLLLYYLPSVFFGRERSTSFVCLNAIVLVFVHQLNVFSFPTRIFFPSFLSSSYSNLLDSTVISYRELVSRPSSNELWRFRSCTYFGSWLPSHSLYQKLKTLKNWRSLHSIAVLIICTPTWMQISLSRITRIINGVQDMFLRAARRPQKVKTFLPRTWRFTVSNTTT